MNNKKTAMADFEGNIDLCICTRDSEASCNCLVGTFFPCIMYGQNYAQAVDGSSSSSCWLPCCCHWLADSLVSGIASTGPGGALQPVHVPLGCLLRATHRQAIAKRKEHCLLSVLVETFCWGCSMAQVHKYLKEHPGEFKSTSSVLGLINSMTEDEQQLNRNGSG